MPRGRKVLRSLSAVPLCLCGFAADFFGCVKDGTHPIIRSYPALEPGAVKAAYRLCRGFGM
ncbi:Uncharacterized protein dnm_056510 [Desulfonema magnum]|uniref:Uncharacterized protein n=1 Tax=Desulfonema magnum TaxID=45655 RepID=A0A975GQ73_9BACT|nr:Uncharacterized protein dnm_056510 [Desulfonema magnum]